MASSGQPALLGQGSWWEGVWGRRRGPRWGGLACRVLGPWGEHLRAQPDFPPAPEMPGGSGAGCEPSESWLGADCVPSVGRARPKGELCVSGGPCVSCECPECEWGVSQV